ncbi:transposase [Allomesorhizobium alhagi]|uniref:transposase n=1 Tax=Allomesorhizobium alhagi TaxID=475067 RepID=UPI001930BC03|nr:transposase [Mesorhizobium alhagi]
MNAIVLHGASMNGHVKSRKEAVTAPVSEVHDGASVGSGCADAEAIVIAAQRPEMRFVEPKSEEQQARAVLFRARQRLVHQRTDLVNALRAILYEYGHVVAQGIHHLTRIKEIVEEPKSKLPELVRHECARCWDSDLICRSPYRPAASGNAAHESLTEDHTQSHVE